MPPRLNRVCLTNVVHTLQLWKKYVPNFKVSYLEYDAPCANKHKTDIEAASGGKLYIGESLGLVLSHHACSKQALTLCSLRSH